MRKYLNYLHYKGGSMIRKDFNTKSEANEYLISRELDMKKGYLTKSEREELKLYLGKPELLVMKEKPKSVGLPIITNRLELSQPSEKVVAGEDIKSIISALKDTLLNRPGAIGLSAPQIGIKKCICYVNIPSVSKDRKSIDYKALVLINPVIIEKDTSIRVNGEGCCSFPRVYVDTSRYVYITIEYLNEDLKQQTACMQDMETFAVQH